MCKLTRESTQRILLSLIILTEVSQTLLDYAADFPDRDSNTHWVAPGDGSLGRNPVEILPAGYHVQGQRARHYEGMNRRKVTVRSGVVQKRAG